MFLLYKVCSPPTFLTNLLLKEVKLLGRKVARFPAGVFVPAEMCKLTTEISPQTLSLWQRLPAPKAGSAHLQGGKQVNETLLISPPASLEMSESNTKHFQTSSASSANGQPARSQRWVRGDGWTRGGSVWALISLVAFGWRRNGGRWMRWRGQGEPTAPAWLCFLHADQGNLLLLKMTVLSLQKHSFLPRIFHSRF